MRSWVLDTQIAGSERVEECSSAVVTCVGSAVKALFATGTWPKVLVKVERPQRSEDERP